MLVRIKTLFALGLLNIGRVFLYRLMVKLGISPVRRLEGSIQGGVFFLPVNKTVDIPANPQWRNGHCYFGCEMIVPEPASPPCWHSNCLTSETIADPMKPWWSMDDFNLGIGDIKTVWEASRFDWVVGQAQAAAQGDEAMLDRLNFWLNDWSEKNPPYQGVNWKCGQEASIRVMHLSVAALILDQVGCSTEVLQALLMVHLQRIEPTLMYAVAQDNNHGTSEAAALYIGGGWLSSLPLQGSPSLLRAKRWHRKGRRLLENRAERLVEADGSFSQYSVNYHRVMLDTYSLVEIWRLRLSDVPFSETLIDRVRAATRWLFEFTDSAFGDAPNLGANDGARLIPLTSTDYRDYRPSVQLASGLFLSRRAYSMAGDWDLPLLWLDRGIGFSIDTEAAALESLPRNCLFPDGGYAILRSDQIAAFIRYPRFRFRPSQSDLLHLDLWYKGVNLLRDGGTYSYNSEPNLTSYFGGVKSHNTIEFDGRDQMPKLSRFLFSGWPKSRDVEYDAVSNRFSVAYYDWIGAFHRRSITLTDNALKVEDEIKGRFEKAVLRWRLSPERWSLNGMSLSNSKGCMLSVFSTAKVIRVDLVEGWESRYYFSKKAVPVFEVEVKGHGKMITEIKFG